MRRNLLVSGSEEGIIGVHSALDYSKITSIKGFHHQFSSFILEEDVPNPNIWTVDLSTSEKYIVSAGRNAIVKLWEVHDRIPKLKSSLRGHTNHVYGVTITPNEKYIISGSEDLTSIVWDLQEGTILHAFRQK
jgi:WD40 repeat protein